MCQCPSSPKIASTAFCSVSSLVLVATPYASCLAFNSMLVNIVESEISHQTGLFKLTDQEVEIVKLRAQGNQID